MANFDSMVYCRIMGPLPLASQVSLHLTDVSFCLFIYIPLIKETKHYYIWQQIKMGFLDPHHYNFRSLEKRHYYSSISKYTITIFRFSQKCHRIRMETTWAQLQVYTNTYIALKALSPTTDSRAPHIIFLLLSPSSHC